MRVHLPARLHVLCSRPEPEPAEREEALRLAGAVRDWGRAIDEAGEEGVLPLLYWNLRGSNGAVPPDVLKKLRHAFLRNLARNTQIYRELEDFLERVRRAGLRAALTKGARLALDVYPDVALRPFWDVDFVVHPGDWTALARILDGLGFAEASPDSGGGPGAAERQLDWTFSPYFNKGSLFLEFHADPLGLHVPGREDDGLWSAAGRLGVLGTEAMVLPAECELCFLCVHAQQHSYGRLIWLADIAGLASRPGLDWPSVVRIARAERIRGPVFHGLRLAAALWPGSIPPEPLAELRPGVFETAGLRLLWSEASTAARGRAPAWPSYMPSLFSLWERRNPRLAARTLRRIFFPPRPWLASVTGSHPASPGLYARYLERLLRPAVTAARRLLRIE